MTTQPGTSSGAAVPPIVLVVEDDPDTRELYHTIFTLEGFWVADAANAELAVEQARDLKPDVVITDVGLAGGCDGVRLASRLHELSGSNDVPIIAVTGRCLSEISPDAEFSEIFQKPVLPNDLVAATRRVIAVSRALRERSELVRERVPGLVAHSRRLLRKSQRIIGDMRERRSDYPGSE